MFVCLSFVIFPFFQIKLVHFASCATKKCLLLFRIRLLFVAFICLLCGDEADWFNLEKLSEAKNCHGVNNQQLLKQIFNKKTLATIRTEMVPAFEL
jgi:hypothetical protein